jgi:ankyrin repeat protein
VCEKENVCPTFPFAAATARPVLVDCCARPTHRTHTIQGSAMSENSDAEAGGGLREAAEEEAEEELGEEFHDEVAEGNYLDARTWLSDALVYGWSLDRIRAVVEAHPESVECDADAEGSGEWSSALHMALWASAEYEIIRYVAQQNPVALRMGDHSGRLPLHLAVIYRSPLAVVRMLVKMHPHALQEAIDDERWRGHLPLHCAFINDYAEDGEDGERIVVGRHGRPDVTMFLIQQHPEAVRSRTANGHLPLHLAFANDDGNPWVPEEGMVDDQQTAPIEVVGALLKTWPESIFETDHRGRLAMHLACRSALTSPAVVRRLVEAWRESLRRRDVAQGDLPIHHAIRCGMPHGIIEFLVNEAPRSVREPTCHGHLALHVLVRFARQHWSPEQALALVQLLLSRDHSAVRYKGGGGKGEGDEGSLPLHVAADRDAPLSVVRCLVLAHRDALLDTSGEGWLPLHLSLWKSGSPDVVRFLVNECPQSLQVCVDGRRLALHVAAEKALKLEFVRAVHQSWPEALREKTETGCTPLHLVVTRYFWGYHAAEGLRIIRYFLDQWPMSVHEATWTGELPVHLAARCASPDAVRLVVERGPKMLLLTRPDDDGALPLHRAASRKTGLKWALEVVQDLIEKAPDALQVADHRGHLPLHAAVSVSGSGSAPDKRFWNQFRLPVVKHLVKAWPHALDVKDKAGRIPLLVAAESDASLGVLYHLLTSCPQAMGGYGCGGDVRRPSQSPCRSKRLRLCASDPDEEVVAGAQESQQLHPLQR